MNHKPNEQLDELLNRATEALRGDHSSAGPSPELTASTIERMRAVSFPPLPTVSEPDVVRLAERRERMFRIASYSSALAAAILIAVFGWLVFSDQGPAFASVIENVKEAKSVVLTNRQTIGNQRTMEMTMYFQDRKMRLEFSGVMAYVADLEAKTAYELDLVRKTARAIPVDAGGAMQPPNPVEQLRKIKPDDARLLGDERYKGRKVRLYEVDKVEFLDAKRDGQMKIWVDPETNLPVKILIDNPQVERGKRTTLEFVDIEWNKELDLELFDVPEGFSAKEDEPLK